MLEKARKGNIEFLLLDRKVFFETNHLVNQLNDKRIDLIVLAGFLWMIPSYLIKDFQNKIINIHPALLPKFGGKGMYGRKVHEAVIENKEQESGITIHYVDEHYDTGRIISQKKCVVESKDTAEIVAGKVQALEHEFYPKVIEQLLTDL